MQLLLGFPKATENTPKIFSGARPSAETTKTSKRMLTLLKNFEIQSDRLSHHSLSTPGASNFNKVDVLSVAEDLEKLQRSVLSKISST